MGNKQYLVVDNGSFCIKAGFSTEETPTKVQNAISKTKDGLLFIGNDHLTQTKNYSGINIKRPHEQGHLTSWETEKPIWDYTLDKFSPQKELDFANIHLTLTETPFQLPQLSINTDQIVFEEYGFNLYYRCSAASLVPWLTKALEVKNDFSLVIDSGFHATWIVPVIYQKVYWKGVKKLPIGGKILNGLLKELILFRHYDITEEPLLVNTIKEETCFVATDFNKTLENKIKSMCVFVLPDFKTTITGYVKDPKKKISDDVQCLKLTDERFTPPESLFHPEIVFDNNTSSSGNSIMQTTPFKNIVDLVVDAIMSCPEVARPLLLANISLVGGTSKLPNFKSRLLLELKKELPSGWFVKFRDYSDFELDEVAWYGGAALTDDEIINDVSVTKREYFEHGSNWCQNQFGFRNL